MNRAFFCPIVLFMAAHAAPARAQEDSAKDAPVGLQSPAVIGWRAPSPGARASLAGVSPARGETSSRLLESLAADLKSEPDCREKADLLGALADLQEGAAKIPPQDRQGWVDQHLGTFNETLRVLGAGAPAPLLKKALRAAAKANDAAQRWEEARQFAEQALEYDPDDHDALISRSQARAGLADFARAYADAERAAKLAPASGEAFTARAAAAYGLGNYLQAAEDARRALALNPENKTAFALMKLSEGRSQAAPEFQKSAPPQLADAVEREYHEMMRQLNQVEERRLSPAEQPGAAAVRRIVASAASKLSVKDYWGAVAEADKALALDSGDAEALYYRAAAHNLLGEYGDAVRDATRGLAMRPSDAPLHDARAWAYNKMGRFAEAIADAHRALEVNPKDAYAFSNRADAEEQRGDYQAMLEDDRAAAEINPQFEPAYFDAARRHGLSAAPLSGGRSSPAAASPRHKRRARSFAVVAFSSLLGGLLIALGILHVNSNLADRRGGPSGSGIEAAYALGKPIGQGGMGVVYEAFDRKLRRPVAIKMLRDEFKLDDAAKADFLDEARTVAELHHPAIVDIHNIIEDSRGLYLIFERLEGRTLDQLIGERRRMPLAEIKRVLKPVCEALEYSHGQDVVHRDLKPANVMLTAEGGVKVLDFGISRHAARAGKTPTTQTVTGTPHYMAPEQEYGVIRKENDVFSLGAVLYEMATGSRPFEGSHQAKLAKGYVRASLRAAELPREFDALIDDCLEPDPDQRLPSPASFWRRLAAIPDPIARA